MTTLDESAIIKIFQSKLGNNKKFVSEDVEIFGICKTKFVAKVDTLVQSTDMPPKMSLADAARKSVVACVSDFASKGAKPEIGIISLNLPKSITRTKINEIAKGLKEASKEFQIQFLGGDTNEGKEIVFHVCLFGHMPRGEITYRKNAKRGDSIFVTGSFGYTAAGLRILLESKKGRKSFVKKATKAVFRPQPKLEFGLRGSKYFSSSMDSSDGLSTTLNEMAKQRHQKCILDKIPIQEDLDLFAKENKIDPFNLIFHGGEEYEFVFTIPKKYKPIIKKISSRLKTPIKEIGFVTKGKGEVFVKREDKKLFRLRDLGWHHFKK